MNDYSPTTEEPVLHDDFTIQIHHDQNLFSKPGAEVHIADPQNILTPRRAEWYYRHPPVTEVQKAQREVIYMILDGGEARSGTYGSEGFDVVSHFQQNGAHVLMVQNGDPGARAHENIPGTKRNHRLISMHRELVQKVFQQFPRNPFEHPSEKAPAIIPIGFSLTALTALILALEHDMSPYIECPEMILISPSSAYYHPTAAETTYKQSGFPLPDEDGDFDYVYKRLREAFQSFNNPDLRSCQIRMNNWEMQLADKDARAGIQPVEPGEKLSIHHFSTDRLEMEPITYASMTYVLYRLIIFQETLKANLYLYGSKEVQPHEHGWPMWTNMLRDTELYSGR